MKIFANGSRKMDFKIDGNQTIIHAKAFEVADLWGQYDKNPHKRNPQTMHENQFQESSDFYGSLQQTRDTIHHNKFVLQDFFQNKWHGKLRSDLSFINFKSKKRKRNLSEHDGDFDFDRVWDVKLFNSTRTEPFDNRVIVDISMNISSWFSPNDIREYGILCFHVVNFIEENGFVCDINLVSECDGMYHQHPKNYTKINIKESDQYQDNIGICKYFTDWFFRRCMFNMWCHYGMEKNLSMDSGLGRPAHSDTKGDKGYLYIAPMTVSQISGQMNFDAIKQAVEKVLGGNHG
jgi:hypothetical protein